jgi:hypothetical protein
MDSAGSWAADPNLLVLAGQSGLRTFDSGGALIPPHPAELIEVRNMIETARDMFSARSCRPRGRQSHTSRTPGTNRRCRHRL